MTNASCSHAVCRADTAQLLPCFMILRGAGVIHNDNEEMATEKLSNLPKVALLGG